MLSGTIRSIPISSITVSPDRQRRELKGVEELAASISTLGLINPIVLTPDLVLVAGERRFRAHEFLGLTHIQAQLTTDLSPAELELIELEENVKRLDLTWREQVAAVVRIHNLKTSLDPEWTQSDTASFLSILSSTLSENLLVQKYLDAGEPLVLEADTRRTAINICLRKEQRKADVEEEALDASIDAAFEPSVSIKGKVPAAKPSPAKPELPLDKPVETSPYLLADFIEWSQQPFLGTKFNFIHCDFPYGINYDKHNSGATGTLGGYADSPEVYLQCLSALERIMVDRVAPSAHLMFWLSARHEIVHQTRLRLEAMGWKLNPVPLIWHRSDNSGIMPDPQRGPRQIYEMCLFGSLGDRKVVQPVSNLVGHPKTKDIHPSEKPIGMLRHFFRMFVDESTVMLDPTMGSGNAIIAAEASGAKSCLGLEREKEFLDLAETHRRKQKALMIEE